MFKYICSYTWVYLHLYEWLFYFYWRYTYNYMSTLIYMSAENNNKFEITF